MATAAIDYNLERTVDPVNEPISLAAAKLHANIPSTEKFFDDWFEGGADEVGAIPAARGLVERHTRLAFMPQTWVLRLNTWPSENDWHDREHYHGVLSIGSEQPIIDLRVHPVQSVVVQYSDANDAMQTWAGSNYELQKTRYRSALMKADLDAAYPTLSTGKPRPITITITAGYSNTTDQTTAAAQRKKVPPEAAMPMYMLLAHWFCNREATGRIGQSIELGYWSLINAIRPHRYR